MKTVIVTVYNSENCGSFFQAYAMGQYLRELGCEVSYLKRPVFGTSHSLIIVMIESLKMLLRYGPASAISVWRRHELFSREQQCWFKTVRGIKHVKRGTCFIIGSDTIWNFEDSYFRRNAKLYTGTLLSDYRYIFYAASGANTSVKTIRKFNIDTLAISRAYAVSTRDLQALEIAKQAGSSDTTIVLDPTMLISRMHYAQFESKRTSAEKYILLYCFETLSDLQYQKVLSFAKEKNLAIHVLGCQQYPNAKMEMANPSSFISAFANADYILTNTYHGTIFSILYQKLFLVTDAKKDKIVFLLNQFGMSDRVLNYSIAFCDQIIRPIDYSVVYEKIKAIKNSSEEFLKKGIFAK